MSKEPLVSVIMPVYNCGQYLELAIESILMQTYANWELLICDDASTDTTHLVIEKYINTDERIKIFRNEYNLKQLKTRNRLLCLAQGELLTFQDGDDFSHIERFEKLVNGFRSNPALGMLSSQVGFINSRGELFGVSKKPTDYRTTQDLMYVTNVIGGSMAMIKRTALDSVGGIFRSYFDGLSYQDYDLSLLIAEKYESYSLPDVLYYYRQHGRSSSKRISVDRLVAKEVVRHLGLQRREFGCDDLMMGRREKIDQYFNSLREPYREDPSLVFRDFASNFMYNKLYLKAIQAAWAGVIRRPFILINWTTFQYCIRKAFLNKLFRV